MLDSGDEARRRRGLRALGRRSLLLLVAAFPLGCLYFSSPTVPGLDGRVVDAATGVPIASAYVFATTFEHMDWNWERTEGNVIDSRWTVTDSNGAFTLLSRTSTGNMHAFSEQSLPSLLVYEPSYGLVKPDGGRPARRHELEVRISPSKYPLRGDSQVEEWCNHCAPLRAPFTADVCEVFTEVICLRDPDLTRYPNGSPRFRGGYRGGARDGVWTFFYESGTKQSEGEFRTAEKVGLWTEWYPSGAKRSENEYDGNLRHGRYTRWYETGRVAETGVYDRGVITGAWASWNARGEPIDSFVIADGRVVSQTGRPELDGTPCPPGTERYDDYVVAEHRRYCAKIGPDGRRVLHGRRVVWESANLRPERLEEYRDGRLTGPAIHWYASGQKASEGELLDGRRHGLWREWYESGGLRSEERYERGERVGVRRLWDEDGRELSPSGPQDAQPRKQAAELPQRAHRSSAPPPKR